MSGRRSEKEERLLQRIIEEDGIKKIQDAITAVISGDVDVSDRAARLLGKVYGSQDILQQRATTKELLTLAYGLYNTTPIPIAVDSSGKLRVVTT